MPGARGRRRRSPSGGHGGAPPKRGTPPPCAPGGPHSAGSTVTVQTRAFRSPNLERDLAEATMSDDDLSQTKREDVVTFLQPLPKEGPYRRDCGMLSTGLR